MSKSQLTLDIEDALGRCLSKGRFASPVLWLFEADAIGNKRADLVVFYKNSYRENRTESVYIEIKISKADFNSGWGLNFNGIRNYICVPVKLLNYARGKLDRMGFDDVGILIYAEGDIYEVKPSQDVISDYICGVLGRIATIIDWSVDWKKGMMRRVSRNGKTIKPRYLRND